MKVGLLAFHYAINFGAALQLLSTCKFMRGKGLSPVVINWIPGDAGEYYNRTAPAAERALWEDMRKNIWRETRLCRTSKDVADVIRDENIEAVVIGSDAVCQCHTLRERIVFPCRTVVGVRDVLSYAVFPNAFWADWNKMLAQPVPVAVISASSQDSKYGYFDKKTRRAMKECVLDYAYMSVRDNWTRDMVTCVTGGLFTPDVTPDPVFAFSQNASDIIPRREDVLRRFRLPEKYVLVSFINSGTVSGEWTDRLAAYAREKDGTETVMLPFAHGKSFGRAGREIPLPLSPLDWYALIRYSRGYIGHNMHPVVVCLHNGVPFFSFDNYGLRRMNGLFPTDKSSKIKHILGKAGLEKQRIPCISRWFKAPSPEDVYDRMRTTDRRKEESFAGRCLSDYNKMMEDVLSVIMT